jgi:hypothetical protein
VSPTTSIESVEAWPVFISQVLNFSIKRPPDMEPMEENNMVAFSKWGPSQKEGTGFYDGIGLSFETGNYSGSFSALVNEKLQEIKDWPTYESSTEPEAIIMAGKEAWSFEAVTMGTATYIFVKRNQTEYLEIINSTKDPTGQGFEAIVEKILRSLELK